MLFKRKSVRELNEKNLNKTVEKTSWHSICSLFENVLLTVIFNSHGFWSTFNEDYFLFNSHLVDLLQFDSSCFRKFCFYLPFWFLLEWKLSKWRKCLIFHMMYVRLMHKIVFDFKQNHFKENYQNFRWAIFDFSIGEY